MQKIYEFLVICEDSSWKISTNKQILYQWVGDWSQYSNFTSKYLHFHTSLLCEQIPPLLKYRKNFWKFCIFHLISGFTSKNKKNWQILKFLNPPPLGLQVVLWIHHCLNECIFLSLKRKKSWSEKLVEVTKLRYSNYLQLTQIVFFLYGILLKVFRVFTNFHVATLGKRDLHNYSCSEHSSFHFSH